MISHPKNIARRLLRQLLKLLCWAVINRHRPEIIAIVGDGPTSLIREALYTVFHEAYPTRRNLEAPEAEFAVPLTVIGNRIYPHRASGWIVLLLKTVLQLLLFKSYRHFLILEMGTLSRESFGYWLEITRPQVIIISGRLASELEKSLPPAKIFKEENTDSTQRQPYLDLAVKIAAEYRIDATQAAKALKHFDFPPARLGLRPGKNGQIIVDATYFSLPAPWTAVAEVAEGLTGEKAVILDEDLYPREAAGIKYALFLPEEIEKAKTYPVLVLRGPKTKFAALWEELEI